MSTWRHLKPIHERAVLDAALRAHNARFNCSLEIVATPDPPDAIAADGQFNVWLEHTDVFYPGWAEDLTSLAASNRDHKPIHAGIHVDIDSVVATKYCNSVLSKVQNPEYAPFISKYGPGILAVGLETPWLSQDTVDAVNFEWDRRESMSVEQVFSHIYLCYRTGGINHAVLWERP